MNGAETINLVLKGIGFLAKVDHNIKLGKKYDKDFMHVLGAIAMDATRMGLPAALNKIETSGNRESAAQTQQQMLMLQLKNLQLDTDLKQFKYEQLMSPQFKFDPNTYDYVQRTGVGDV